MTLVPLMDRIDRPVRHVAIPARIEPLEASTDVVAVVTGADGQEHRILIDPAWCIDLDERPLTPGDDT